MQLDVFPEIDSTNTWLLQQSAPPPGELRIAATCNQTAGRGRHGKVWHSPSGSGLCLSAAYTFENQPSELPALTLAIGLAAVNVLQGLGVRNAQLKWPNDLVADDGKLGGILTEVRAQAATATTVVTGIGVNVDLPEDIAISDAGDWALRAVDLTAVCDDVPHANLLAATLTSKLFDAFSEFESHGFAQFADRWAEFDWLYGRQITVDSVGQQITGIGAGIADDGALLVEQARSGVQRITSGSIIMAASS